MPDGFAARALPHLHGAALLTFVASAAEQPLTRGAAVYLRWGLLFVLSALAACAARSLPLRRTRPACLALGLFGLTALGSAGWSESPTLTVVKASAFLLVSLTFFVTGQVLGRRHAFDNPFAPLAVPCFVLLLSSCCRRSDQPLAALTGPTTRRSSEASFTE